MSEEIKPADTISPEIQEVMRGLVSAIRAVKLYPPNNPIYSQSVHKAYESLDRYLGTSAYFPVGVQRTHFLFEDLPVAKDTQINRTIAQDLFAKGIREIVFHAGMREDELIALFKALALTAEEMAMQNGLVSILWEKDATHIKVTEAALEEVILTQDERPLASDEDDASPVKLRDAVARRELHFKGRTLLLGDIVEDPRTFGAKMLEIAQQTVEEGESVEDRLHALYQDAGRMAQGEDPAAQDALFRGLARSVLEMEQEHRNKFISSKLYAHLDAEQVRAQQEGTDPNMPEELHEIVTGRFAQEWSVRQIASLLKKTAQQEAEVRSPQVLPSQLEAIPLPADVAALAKELAEYTPDEMETLKAMGEVGAESDITEAALRTMLFLMPHVKNPAHPGPPDREIKLFSGLVHQLEDLLSYLLKHKDYDLAAIVIRALHMPVDQQFRPRLEEAIKIASTRDIINTVVGDMRKSQKGSPDYLSAYGYLSALDQEATAVLLEALAVEKDRAVRKYLIEIVKELGKKQIATIGKRIVDGRWFVVRNIVHILAETRSEEVLPYLEKVIGHKQLQIRHEVIKALINIGGRKASFLLARFLRDADPDIQTAAVRGLGVMHGIGSDALRALEGFLEGRSLTKKEHGLTLEGIGVLGRAGDALTTTFLGRYARRRWWKPKKLQSELRDAAAVAIENIRGRQPDGGRTA